MPLLPTILQDELSKIMDSDYPSFSGFGNSQLEIAEKWADALGNYTVGIVIPSTMQSLAKQSFISVFSTIVQPNGIPLIQQAFTTYGSSLAIGMITPAFTAVPPPIPIDLTPVFSIPTVVGTNQARVSLLTTIIDSWFRTGTFTQISSGVTSTWN